MTEKLGAFLVGLLVGQIVFGIPLAYLMEWWDTPR
jgi:hypothetical protein